eukprot:scaffold179427_cov33-Attheya_sp.AAC.3
MGNCPAPYYWHINPPPGKGHLLRGPRQNNPPQPRPTPGIIGYNPTHTKWAHSWCFPQFHTTKQKQNKPPKTRNHRSKRKHVLHVGSVLLCGRR